MLALERPSSLERAAFLLHDVFDLDFKDVAGVLTKTRFARCLSLMSVPPGPAFCGDFQDQVSEPSW